MRKNVKIKNLIYRGSQTAIYILRAVLYLAADLADGKHTSTDAVTSARKDNVNASIFHFSRFLFPPALMRSIDFFMNGFTPYPGGMLAQKWAHVKHVPGNKASKK